MSEWQPIETVPMKEDVGLLLLTSVGVTEARYSSGYWSRSIDGDEWNGPVWVCCDDTWQIEIEQIGENDFHHGQATHWMPLPEPPKDTKE